MKTTIDLPDELFAAVKEVAAKRGTTLDAVLERALRREIQSDEKFTPDAPFELNRYGFPVLKKRGKAVVTSEQIYRMLDGEAL